MSMNSWYRGAPWARLLGGTFLLVLLLTLRAAAHPNKPGAPQAEPILLDHATLHTITGEVIDGGQLLFADGQIAAIGTHLEVPPAAQTIDLHGEHVYPGFIDANSVLGLKEIGAVSVTLDLAEVGPINPNVKADTAINPDSELIPVARSTGILTAHICPRAGDGGILLGTSVLTNLDGWTIEEMTLKSPVGMHVEWPAVPSPTRYRLGRRPDRDSRAEEAEKEYRERVRILSDAVTDARAYLSTKQNGANGAHGDLRWEAMIPVLQGDVPIIVHADRVRQMRDAIHWALREKLRLIIMGGRDAWRLAGVLCEHKIPVIVSEVNSLPMRRWEPYDVVFDNANKLYQAGVTFAIANDAGGSNTRNLPYSAAQAVAHGLPHDEAIRALTIYPAIILGVADCIGSLEVGKDATFFVTDGDPLDIRSQVSRAFIQGRAVDLSNRHTRLYEKYVEKYRRLDSH